MHISPSSPRFFTAGFNLQAWTMVLICLPVIGGCLFAPLFFLVFQLIKGPGSSLLRFVGMTDLLIEATIMALNGVTFCILLVPFFRLFQRQVIQQVVLTMNHLELGRFIPILVPYGHIHQVRISGLDPFTEEPSYVEVSWKRKSMKARFGPDTHAFATALFERSPMAILVDDNGTILQHEYETLKEEGLLRMSHGEYRLEKADILARAGRMKITRALWGLLFVFLMIPIYTTTAVPSDILMVVGQVFFLIMVSGWAFISLYQGIKTKRHAKGVREGTIDPDAV